MYACVYVFMNVYMFACIHSFVSAHAPGAVSRGRRHRSTSQGGERRVCMPRLQARRLLSLPAPNGRDGAVTVFVF